MQEFKEPVVQHIIVCFITRINLMQISKLHYYIVTLIMVLIINYEKMFSFLTKYFYQDTNVNL